MSLTKVITSGLFVNKQLISSPPDLLAKAKKHLLLDDDDTSQDSLLSVLIDSAIIEIEQHCGISINRYNITARWESLGADYLPYPPINTISTNLEDKGWKQRGLLGGVVKIDAESEEPVEIKYEAGYTSLPKLLEVAILKNSFDNFEQRGGFNLSGRQILQQYPNNWKEIVKSFRQITWFG